MTDLTTELFARNLWYLRRLHGLTQPQLAELLGVEDRSSVSVWETSRGFPKLTTLFKMANLFGVSIDQLITFDWAQNTRNTERK